MADAGREAGEEVVAHGLHLVVGQDVVFHHTEFAFGREGEIEGVAEGIVGMKHHEGGTEHVRCHFAVGGIDLVFDHGELGIDFVPSLHGGTIHRDDAVALAQAGLAGGAVGGKVVDESGQGEGYKGRLLLDHLEQVDAAAGGNVHLFAAAQHVDGLCFAQVAEHFALVEMGVGLTVGPGDDVAVAET